MLAVAFPADNIDWGGIHWNPSFLHTGGDHSEARRCFDCSGQKRQSLAALRRDYRCPKNDCNPSENRCDTDHSGYGTVRQENGKAACPVWRIAKKTLDDGKIPVLPYTRYKGSKEGYRPWDYKYDPVKDVFTCPHGQELRHTTTDRDGKRIYRSTPKYCVNCLSKSYCKANEKGQKVFTTHIWQEYLDIVESIRKTDLGKQIYAQRKETIERVFADAKEKHAMRYTHHRGLAAVTRWVRLKFAAMNLKKLAQWSWKDSMFSLLFVRCCPIYKNAPTFAY